MSKNAILVLLLSFLFDCFLDFFFLGISASISVKWEDVKKRRGGCDILMFGGNCVTSQSVLMADSVVTKGGQRNGDRSRVRVGGGTREGIEG